jgi:cell division protein FtsW
MSLFFIAGGNLLHIFFGTFIASLFAWPVVLSHEYIRLRLLSFLDHTIDPQGAGYQIKQALMTIGSGQWFGVGFGKSVQKFGYLPEVQGDTIFAIASEELGFVFIVLFISLFLFIAFKGYMVALRAPDRFSKLLATGVTSWIFVQSFLHISVNLAIFPLTGVTLPFVSYGGTSLLIMAFASGVLLNISRYASKEDSLFTEWRGVRRSHHTINRPYDLPKREVSGV